MSPCELSHLIDRVRIGTLLDMEMAMPRTAQASVPALLPIMGSVFISFLIVGVAMPVLPLHVHQGLGLGTFIVGLVAGSQFAASLVSRVWAGRHADGRGAKHAVTTGLVLAAVAGVLYRSEEHTSELQSRLHLVCRLLLEKKKKHIKIRIE